MFPPSTPSPPAPNTGSLAPISVLQTSSIGDISTTLFSFSLDPQSESQAIALPAATANQPEAQLQQKTGRANAISTISIPRAVRQRPGPRRGPIADFQRKPPRPMATPSRMKRAMTVEFKLGVLSWWHHSQVEDSKGGLRIATRAEVQKQFGIKNACQLTRWRKVSCYQIPHNLKQTQADLRLQWK